MDVLMIIGRYLPGYKSGGALRAIANIVDRLGDEFRFRIITRDRDGGDLHAYPSMAVDRWQRVGKAEVLYLSPGNQTRSALQRAMRNTPHDVLYLNSFFNPRFSILPLTLRHLGLVPQVPTVVAPEGEFSPGALRLKAYKKQPYYRMARLLGLYRDVTWRAATELEREDIQRMFGRHARVRISPDLTPHGYGEQPAPRREKEPGRLRMVFLSRIVRKKNLDGALQMLQSCEVPVELDIFGPLEDAPYWQECQTLIGRLPTTVQVNYRGQIPHSQVTPTLAQYDVLYFPTRGENFGYNIVEALSVGTPVLVSDQTPWRDLENQQIGWDIPLNDPQAYLWTLRRLHAMGQSEHQKLCQRAREVARQYTQDSQAVELNRQLFYGAVGRVAPAPVPTARAA